MTEERLANNEPLRTAIDSVQTAEFLDAWARELELARIWAEIEANRQLSEASEAIELRLKSGLEDRLEQTARLQELLVDAELRLAGVLDLQARIVDLERELAEARRDAESARAEAGALEQRVTTGEQVLADVMGSPSWRLTQPLRTAKHSISRLRAGGGQ